MQTFEGLLEPRTQRIKQCSLASKDCVAARLGGLNKAELRVRWWINLKRVVSVIL